MPPGKDHMGAKYSLPPFDWLKLSHHLVSGESTLHEVTLFEARSRIFLPAAQSCAALFCCRLAIRASSLGWLVGSNKSIIRNVYFLYFLIKNLASAENFTYTVDILSLRVRGAEVKKTEGEEVTICFLCREEILKKTTIDHQ